MTVMMLLGTEQAASRKPLLFMECCSYTERLILAMTREELLGSPHKCERES